MAQLHPPADNITPLEYTDLALKRVFIVGHQDFSVDGIASLLESQGQHFAISCMEPGEACMSRLALASPDVLMVQNEAISEPLEGFFYRLFDDYPDIRVLVFGKDMEDEHLFGLVRSGVHGYINQHMGGHHIVSAINSVLEGNTWIERHIMERFIALQHQVDEVVTSQLQHNIEQLCTTLTRREIEILRQVVKGLAIKQIADEVHLSHQGVKMHLAKLFRKFGVSNRNQLILAAFDSISPVEELSSLLQNGLDRNLQQVTS